MRAGTCLIRRISALEQRIAPSLICIGAPLLKAAPRTRDAAPPASRRVPMRAMSSKPPKAPTVLDGVTYQPDDHTNVTTSVLSKVHRGLHRTRNHPIFILRDIIESHFNRTSPGMYQMFDQLHPVVTPKQNFDDLLIPKDHVGRLPSDTYFLNRDHLLRTHTSAHQAEILRKGVTDFLVAADVYRRDEIDRSHYPVFHQMEGVRTFKRGAIEAVPPQADSSITLIDETTIGTAANPIQPGHSEEEARALAASLKHALNGLIRSMFVSEKDLTIRWIEAYFPFTSPSYEVEIMYKGKWLEVLGCGVMRQEILDNAGESIPIVHFGISF